MGALGAKLSNNEVHFSLQSLLQLLLSQNLNQRLIPKLIPTCYMGDIILMLMVMLDIMDIHMLTMAKGLLSQLLNQKLIQRLILTCCTVDIMDILMLIDTMDIPMFTESNLKYLLPIFF